MTNKLEVKSEQDISQLIRADKWRIDVLNVAERLDLPNWWIGAGFLRNLIWDAIEGNPPRKERDVDLVYFDLAHKEPEYDWAMDEKLKSESPIAEWEVRNQARMHYVNGFKPYASTEEGISNWVETATCIAVRQRDGKLEYLFCHGTNDLFNLIARPIEAFKTEALLPVFYGRIEKKKWQVRWPSLQVVTDAIICIRADLTPASVIK